MRLCVPSVAQASELKILRRSNAYNNAFLLIIAHLESYSHPFLGIRDSHLLTRFQDSFGCATTIQNDMYTKTCRLFENSV